LATGFSAVIDHGNGLSTGYYHLSDLHVAPGQVVKQVEPVGIVGGSPIGYGLVHLHFDVLVKGVPQDAERWMRKWQYIPLAEAALSVGLDDPPA
jgi:murein DD-endopeptidase MepM/ murein hydrolase activator NlpD